MASRERGQATITVVMTLVVLVGMMAIVVDTGLLLVGRARLSAALDAAVLAAAQDMPNTSAAYATLNQYVSLNVPVGGLFSEPEVTVTFSGVFPNTVTAHADQIIELAFARIFGLYSTTVSAESRAVNMDPDLVLVLDRSGSMCEDSHGPDYPDSSGYCPECEEGWEPMDSVKAAGSLFVSELGVETMMGVVSYATYPELDVPLSDLRDEWEEVVVGIEEISPSGYTDIGGGIYTAIDELLASGRPNPKAIVLITDGRANVKNGHFYWWGDIPANHTRDAAHHADDNGIVIFTIAFGSGADQNLMAEVAEIAHGQYYYAPDSEDLQPIFEDIAEQDYVRLMPLD